MKKLLIVCTIINIAISITFTYFMHFKKDSEMINMVDVTTLNKEEAVSILCDYEIEIIYEESYLEVNKVIKTDPSVNELTQKGQKVLVYLSSGEVSIYYKNLVNTYYEDNVDYLLELENSNISIKIFNNISDDYPDGVIISQSLEGKINSGDILELVVNYKKPLIFIPDFVGKTDTYVINHFKENDINIKFIYTKNDGSNVIYDQSIQPNSLVISGLTLYIYISI